MDSSAGEMSPLATEQAVDTRDTAQPHILTAPKFELVESGDEADQEDELEVEPAAKTDDDDGDGSDASSPIELEGSLDEISDEDLVGGDHECTVEEAKHLRALLWAVGPQELVDQTLNANLITARKLITAFHVRASASMDACNDEALYPWIGVVLGRQLAKRIKLPQHNTIDDAVALIQKARNIIVLTGAGISTSLGIPDFRSKDTGLYSKLAHLGLNDPQEVFDISIFREDPSIFFSVAKDIIPDIERFTPTHAFINLLQQKGKLLTNYSQNIDNIESIAGILPEKLIQCHGSFATATCQKCGYQVDGQQIFPDIRAGRIPHCDRCVGESRRLGAPAAMKRKRSNNGQDKKQPRFDEKGGDSSEEDSYDDPQSGVMKPDITFFGEALPDKFGNRLNHDRPLIDLVIVIGTSLKVAPVSEVVPYLPSEIPQIYISRTPISHINFDIDMLGDCDIVVTELCRRAGWELKHEMIPDNQEIDVKLDEGYSSRHIFTVKQSEDVEEA
ncbi:related to sirtuin 5 and related class III sirtuins (SIR2 family) [Rhynchosporium agropyri]|uniref:Related to sirtuin 5 and related class III sirtuins (SIR2 family) n=1 Tax=Rhynchosporium agropyri TaxID=914238 RepID=A0A1E1LBV3_9HELO|nr:related to sirtuin 5 and related class III sirtuins (SIR2 family) [Rhynchosporium agropyri]